MSNGVSVFIDGERLTSNNHGFRDSSINTSKPSNSKQLEGWWGLLREVGRNISFPLISKGSTATIVLMIMSLILSNNLS